MAWFAQLIHLFDVGEDHRRHRKILLPGFTGPESKAYAPVFSSYASKVCQVYFALELATS